MAQPTTGKVRRPSMRPCSPITQQSWCMHSCSMDRSKSNTRTRTVPYCKYMHAVWVQPVCSDQGARRVSRFHSRPLTSHLTSSLGFSLLWSFPSLILFFPSTSCRPCSRQPVHDATVRRSPEAAKPAVPFVSPSHSHHPPSHETDWNTFNTNPVPIVG